MLDTYSVTIGVGLGLVFWAVFEVGKRVRTAEVRDVQRAGADMGVYLAPKVDQAQCDVDVQHPSQTVTPNGARPFTFPHSPTTGVSRG